MERLTFAQRVAQARRELGVARHEDVAPSDLARMVGVSPKTVYSWERGANMPTTETAELLASVLGVTPGWLLFGHEPKYASPTAEGWARYNAYRQREAEQATARDASERAAGEHPSPPGRPGKPRR